VGKCKKVVHLPIDPSSCVRLRLISKGSNVRHYFTIVKNIFFKKRMWLLLNNVNVLLMNLPVALCTVMCFPTLRHSLVNFSLIGSCILTLHKDK
jgi:hypothetical protein